MLKGEPRKLRPHKSLVKWGGLSALVTCKLSEEIQIDVAMYHSKERENCPASPEHNRGEGGGADSRVQPGKEEMAHKKGVQEPLDDNSINCISP